MANIGLGLLAADQYFKEGDARNERQYVQAKRDAELSTLGDKTAADRSGYQLRDVQNRANTEVLPTQTANAKARLGLDATDMAGEAERKPAEIKTKNINAKIGLANAENDQANVPASLRVKNNVLQTQLQTSDATLKQLPMRLQQLATQGVLDQRGQSEVVLGTMGQLIDRWDKAGALAFANDVAKQGNVLPNSNGKVFTDIVPVRRGQNGAQGDGYNFVTSDGESRFVPVEAISGAMNKLKAGEYQFITSEGSLFAGNKKTGDVKQVYRGDPRAYRAQNTPAEIQTMEYLVSRGVAKTPEAAWEQVRSAREKTRSAFIMDYVSKGAGIGSDPYKMSEDAGKIYDALRTNLGPVNPTRTAPRAAPSVSVDPQIRDLLGIPAQ